MPNDGELKECILNAYFNYSSMVLLEIYMMILPKLSKSCSIIDC